MLAANAAAWGLNSSPWCSHALQPALHHLSSVSNVSHNKDVRRSQRGSQINKYPNNHGYPTEARERGLMTAVVSEEAEGTGGYHVISHPRSHWKGQRYNYTHQRKSRVSENWSLLCSSVAAQVPRVWPNVPKREFVFQTHRAWIIISFHHCRDNGNSLSFLMVEECSGRRKSQWSSSTTSALFQTFK